jgi:hypothetical protein
LNQPLDAVHSGYEYVVRYLCSCSCSGSSSVTVATRPSYPSASTVRLR